MLQGGRFQILLGAAVLTVAATPFLVRIAPAIGRRAAALARQPKSGEITAKPGGLSAHVIVVGYGMSGQLLARVLRETRIPYLVIELDPDIVRRAREEDVPVLFGDVARREILESAGIERAKIVVFEISDFSAVVRSVKTARQLAANVEIIIRTRRFTEIETLRKVGADHVVAEEFESAIEVFTKVLASYHVPRNVIRAETRVLRGESYRMLRSAPLGPASEAVLSALEAGTTDIYRIASDGRAAGRTLRDLDLRRQTGTSVIAVVRGERSQPNPPPELKLEAGDCLVLVGSHEEIDRAFQFLDDGQSAGADQ